MYGTIARFKVKPGMEDQLRSQMSVYDSLKVPGFLKTSIYRMDADSSEYYMTVAFENKDAYFKNAQSPEQDARYREFVELLEGPPEWHDGEIVYDIG